MDVILLHDVQKLGRRGQKVNVARGHARNFLFPQGLAVRADQANQKELEVRLQSLQSQDDAGREAAEALAAAMQDASITITAAAGEENLYGSVTAAMIAEALVALGHGVQAKQIVLEEPLKRLGSFSVPVRVHHDVTVEIQVAVERA
jgi:large subunit ribosomal protein L9